MFRKTVLIFPNFDAGMSFLYIFLIITIAISLEINRKTIKKIGKYLLVKKIYNSMFIEKILSAIKSKFAPYLLVVFNFLAKKPSKKSEIDAKKIQKTANFMLFLYKKTSIIKVKIILE